MSFQVWSTPTGHVRTPEDNLQDFRAALTSTPAIEHNRAKPMSESSSAITSIADDGEFRFARFYNVYEGVPLVLPESPPIVSGASDMRPPGVQTWKRHGIRCSHRLVRNATFFEQNVP